jgi:small subunit ribosomal protein S15
MQKQEIISKHARKKGDTGSPEVQVALLTARIEELSKGHLSAHKRDHSGRRGLLKLVGQRRSLLRYLSSKSPERYHALIASLGLRK